MGELSKKLHYKKTDGTQGEVSIYDSLEDCPEPNLKVKVDGIQGYVKLGTADDGETVPIKVKTNTAGVLNVIKTTVPTGSMTLIAQEEKKFKAFVIPNGVKVLRLYNKETDTECYVGVTTGKTYELCATYLYIRRFLRKRRIIGNCICRQIYTESGNVSGIKSLFPVKIISAITFTISWSPEINNHAINKEDYITD